LFQYCLVSFYYFLFNINIYLVYGITTLRVTRPP